MELNDEQLDQLALLEKHSGFQLYLVLLKDRFEIEYRKLRKCQRDKTFDKINGFLNGLEYAENLVNSSVQERHNPGNGAAEGD